MERPPTELIEDAIAEVLLRLPPDEPAGLFRAALVCKLWMRILSDPNFLRRYRAFHRAPPLLGFFNRNGRPTPLLVPTAGAAMPAFPLPASGLCTPRALDCRHGRVLLHTGGDQKSAEFLVWDPVTGDRHALPSVDIRYDVYCHSAAVLCGVGGCDHIDCHGGCFLVVFIATDYRYGLITTRVYSSETGAWSTPAFLDNGDDNRVQPTRGALIGDEIFFVTERAIVKHDWHNNCLSLINQPPEEYDDVVTLMVMDSSSLGFIGARDCSCSLYLWSGKVNAEGPVEWVQCRVIELEAVIPMANPRYGAYVVGFAEGVDAIFISTDVGLFMIELKSGRQRKIGDRGCYSILPYMSFYTPGDVRLSSIVLADV